MKNELNSLLYKFHLVIVTSIWTQKWVPQSMPSDPNSRKNNPIYILRCNVEN